MRTPHNDPLEVPDTDARASDSGPERRCVLTGKIGQRNVLVRLALSPDGEVLPDALAKAPGRGAWIGVDKPVLEAAVASGKLKGALARAFKLGAVTVPADLAERIEIALTRAMLDRLGLELRAGRLILGAEKIETEARLGRVAALFHARDASGDGARKLDQAWRVGNEAEGTGLAGVRLPLDRAALSVALGRGNVVHLALADRASAERVGIPLQRLVNFAGAAAAAAALPVTGSG